MENREENPHAYVRYSYIQDPGHGWLKVRKAEVESLGFRPSPYSFWDGQGWAYLEEDCDMPAFLALRRAKLNPGVVIALEERHVERTRIRDLPRFPRCRA